MSSLVEICHLDLEIFKSVNTFSLFRNYIHWKRMWYIFEHPWVPFIQGRFVPSLDEIISLVLEKMYFCHILIITYWRRSHSFKHLNSLYPSGLCVNLIWNLFAGSGEFWEFCRFFICVNVFSLFRNYLPLKRVSFYIRAHFNSLR